ncbi:MAG: hypothetical protein MUE63_07980 [Xanthomonadales bacterium]|nr:hypothetical protein [Xanthomonadales bacterium]
MRQTGLGKPAVAMALVDCLPVELNSVDSAQSCIDMSVGTVKPDRAILARHRHRLSDLMSPEESHSAARFRPDVRAAMAGITAAGKLPVLVGGTLLHFCAPVGR